MVLKSRRLQNFILFTSIIYNFLNVENQIFSVEILILPPLERRGLVRGEE